MPASQTPGLQVGSRVTVEHPKCPGIWLIKSFGPKNAVLEPEAGGRGVRIPPAYLSLVDAEQTSAAAVVEQPLILDSGAIVQLRPGVITLDGEPNTAEQLFVVTADKYDIVNVARLGGSHGYWRVPRKTIINVLSVDAVTVDSLLAGVTSP